MNLLKESFFPFGNSTDKIYKQEYSPHDSGESISATSASSISFETSRTSAANVCTAAADTVKLKSELQLLRSTINSMNLKIAELQLRIQNISSALA